MAEKSAEPIDIKKMIQAGMNDLFMSLAPRPKEDGEEDLGITDDDFDDESDEDPGDTPVVLKLKRPLLPKSSVKSKEEKEVLNFFTGSTEVGMDRNKQTPNKQSLEAIMKKSVITPDFETLESLPPLEIGRRQRKKLNREKREKSRGEKWFDLPAPEMTDDIKNDLRLLCMRSAIDKKHFYKKNDLKDPPKYFHVGRIIESPADFYNGRVPKKQRKRTMVEELMADAEFQQLNKKRYTEIIEERRKSSAKAHRHANRLKRKGKSRKK